MLKSRIMLRRNASYLKWSYTSARRFSQPAEESDELYINLDVRLATLPKKKPQREPFVKNFFIGKFDNEVIAYPEVLTNERQKQFEEWLAPIEDCVNRNFNSATEKDQNILPFEGIEQLRELGVFRANLSLENRGIAINTTEYAKLVEVLAKNPSLATYVASRTDPIDMLLKHGTEEQKKKYIPKFVSGDLIPTFALLETDTDNSTTGLAASAVATACKNFWKLNAEKVHVTNGNQANCFIVLANCTETNDPFHKPQTPTLFVVEREHGGISSNTRDKLGQQAVETCSVTFKDCLVPKENLIGKIGSAPTILIKLLTQGKQNVGSQATTILKNLINEVTKHTINKRHYDQQLMATDLAQEVIGKMTASLYAIESMTYLTTGLEDQFEDQDISVESAIVEAYAAKACIEQISQGLQLIGKEAYLKDHPFEKIYRDALALNWFNSSRADLCVFIAIMGLHHTGHQTAEVVQKYRNPLMFPKFIFKEVFASSTGPDLAIEEHLHPTLIVSAKFLSHSLHLLAASTETLLIRHGNKVAEFHMELNRLADMAIEIYAMTAVLARSSRSYCIGLRHSMDDVYIAHTICFHAHKKVKAYNEELDVGEEGNCDDIYKKLARRVIQQKGYFPEHPLKKNY